MSKKIVSSLILAVFVLGILFILPKKISEISPTYSDYANIRNNKPNISIIIVGDIMLGRSVMNESFKKKDFTYPFRNVASVLRQADIVIGNLETPIVKDCPLTTTGMIFCTRLEMIEGLRYSGIDIVSIANNHTANYGESGLRETEKYLNESGIDFLDGTNFVIKEIDGIKFGFLGFNFLYRKPTETEINLIRESKENADVLFAIVHWGEEYTSEPIMLQKEIAEMLKNEGVDVVVGTHPHWVQSIDKAGNKLIFYSLGNFVFDQPWSENTKKGLAIRLIYQNDKLIKIEDLPVYMKNTAQPEWTSF